MKAKLGLILRAIVKALISPDARRYEIALGFIIGEAIRKALGLP